MVVGHLSLNKIDVFRANTTKYLKKYEIQSILGNNPTNQSLTSNFVSDSILTRMDGSGAKKKFTGLGFIAIPRLRDEQNRRGATYLFSCKREGRR